MALQDEIQKQEQRDQEERDRAYLDHVMPQIYDFLNKELGGIPRNRATELAVVECCDNDPLKVSLDHVKLLLDDNTNKGLRARLGTRQTVLDQKTAIIERIMALLEGTRDSYGLNNEMKRLGYFDIPALLKREQDIIAAQENAGKTTTQLRGEVRAQRSGFQEFEPLPAQYTPPGKPECPVPWSQQLLKKLGETGTGNNNALRILLRKHGPHALNEAIRLAELRKGAR